MKFNKYDSLTNRYNTKDIIDFIEAVPDDIGWVVTEKIHGANFQFKSERPESDTNMKPDVRVGKRTGWTDTNFFKLQSSDDFLDILQTIQVAMTMIYYTRPEVNSIEIDGEVYGGNIQKGIFYSRSKRFAAFDIKINDVFINHDEYWSITQEYNIPRCPILRCGSREACMDYPNTFNSHVPEQLEEPIPDSENICEGIVIKPMITTYLSNGTRVAIKDKNDKWSEKASMKKKTPSEPLEGNDMAIYELLSNLVDENRIASAISKIGNKMRNIPELLEEVNRDILEAVHEDSYRKYVEAITVDITADNTNKIRRLLAKRIVTLIKRNIREV